MLRLRRLAPAWSTIITIALTAKPITLTRADLLTPDSALVTDLSPSPNFGDRRGRAIDAIVLHYTGMSTGAAALAKLCDPAAEVSCHYLIWEDGRIEQLVAEQNRAWHAGRAFWAGERDVNALSIGIEIVNAGHDGGCPPYPASQIDAVIALCRDLRARHAIVPRRVLAHSDVAPDRKMDPGEYFPWGRLAHAGVVPTVPAAPIIDGPILREGNSGAEVEALQRALAALGFDAPRSSLFDPTTTAVVTAFQRRHRPTRVDGAADESTIQTLKAILASAC